MPDFCFLVFGQTAIFSFSLINQTKETFILALVKPWVLESQGFAGLANAAPEL